MFILMHAKIIESFCRYYVIIDLHSVCLFLFDLSKYYDLLYYGIILLFNIGNIPFATICNYHNIALDFLYKSILKLIIRKWYLVNDIFSNASCL